MRHKGWMIQRICTMTFLSCSWKAERFSRERHKTCKIRRFDLFWADFQEDNKTQCSPFLSFKIKCTKLQYFIHKFRNGYTGANDQLPLTISRYKCYTWLSFILPLPNEQGLKKKSNKQPKFCFQRKSHLCI